MSELAPISGRRDPSLGPEGKGSPLRNILVMVLVALLMPIAAVAQVALDRPREAEGDPVTAASRALVLGPPTEARLAVDSLIRRGNPDIVATTILGLRFREDMRGDFLRLLKAVTGEEIDGWNQAMLWQQAHPEVRPHASYRELKLVMFDRIDRAFRVLLGGDRSDRDKMEIRLEEIAWGGVRFDGIPSLDGPAMIAAAEADYLLDEDLVFGVAINGDVRAYPLRIMGWHEMFNDVVGGVPVALAYCTLCGAGILFETKLEGRSPAFVFGSSGFLYGSIRELYALVIECLERQEVGLWTARVSRCGFRRRAG